MTGLERVRTARHVAVYGYGREGRAVVDAMPTLAPDAIVTVVNDTWLDEETVDDLGRRHVVVAHGSEPSVQAGLDDVDVVVRSPGVPTRSPRLRRAVDRGAHVTTGTNLWFDLHRPDNVLAITGTKGKSTTTALLAHLLRSAGRDVVAAGNIGTPLLALDAPPQSHDHVVIELSSYQLADLDARLAVGVFLNLHREHLDWHGDHETYRADKSRIVGLSQVLVANAADADVMARSADHPDRRVFDARTSSVQLGHTHLPAADLDAALAASPLVGEHHRHNLAGALAAAAVVRVDPESLLPHVAGFSPLPHRLELVHDDGRRWVDDSISTIPEAAVAALTAFPRDPVTLLLGGFERQQDHAPLVAALADRRDVTVVTMPVTGHRFADEVAGDHRLTVLRAADLAEAVAVARERTPADGVVLLSPAAPSYGAFRDFEERGRRFAELARSS